MKSAKELVDTSECSEAVDRYRPALAIEAQREIRAKQQVSGLSIVFNRTVTLIK